MGLDICQFCTKDFMPKNWSNPNKFCSVECRINNQKKTLRNFNKGRTGKSYNDFYGKELADQVKKKISKAISEFNIKNHIIPPSRKGIPSIMPKEFFERIGALSVIAQDKKKGPTSIEKKIYKYLSCNRVDYHPQYLINNHFVVDVYIPSLNLIIEADGDYWHALEKNKKKDKAKTAYLTKCGFDLLRLTETEINNNDFINKLEWRFK